MTSASEPTFPSLIGPADLDWLCALAASAPPGDFVELGVYKGGSAERLYQIAEAQGRRLWLFDTFSGHPANNPAHDDVGHHHVGKYADAVDPHELQRRLPRAIIARGVFPETFGTLIDRISFVHSDLDLYDPTEAVCRLLPPRMVAGGMLYFDDYGWEECPGVREAVDAHFGVRPALPNGKRLVVLP